MELKGSRTEQNLRAAFAGESEARNKYTYYASQARKDGMNLVANIFEETAGNEKEHAKIWFNCCTAACPRPLKTCSTPLRARDTNGPRCTPALPRPPRGL